jgi:hypothetical protein
MIKNMDIYFGKHTLEVAGWFSPEDKSTNKPNEFDITFVKYNDVDIFPLLQSMPYGFYCIEAIENAAIFKSVNED